jgi:hypothetical protein
MQRANLRVDNAGHVVHCAALERRITPVDASPGGRMYSSAVSAVVAALARSTVSSSAGLLEEALPATALEAPAPTVLASPNWHCCETLYVVVPSVDSCQPGVWSLLASLSLRVHEGTCLPLLMAIGGPKQRTSGFWQRSGPGSLGVLLTNPFPASRLALSSSAGSGLSDQTMAKANAYMRNVWGSLVAVASASAIVAVAHGDGTEPVLNLLSDAEVGTDVQRRVCALALLDPPRRCLSAASTSAVASSSPGSPSWFGGKKAPVSSRVGPLSNYLRARAFAWRSEPHLDVRLACSNDDLSAGISGALVELGAPSYLADAGCVVQTARVAVTGFVSSHDPVSKAAHLNVCAALLPTAVAPQVSAFAKFMLSDPGVATAAGFDGGPAVPERSPSSSAPLLSAGSFIGVTRAIAASRGEASVPPLPIARKTGSAQLAPAASPFTGGPSLASPRPLPDRAASSPGAGLAVGTPRTPAHVPAVNDASVGTPRTASGSVPSTPRASESPATLARASTFLQPPTLSPPYDRIRDAAVEKLELLLTNLELWKPTGLSKCVPLHASCFY